MAAFNCCEKHWVETYPVQPRREIDGMLLFPTRVGLTVAGALFLMEPPDEAAAFRANFLACKTSDC